jgi:hypothetical protein
MPEATQLELDFGPEFAKPEIDINPGHYLELMDRLAVQADIIHNYIYEHPLTDLLPEVNAKVEVALTNLYDAYQLVGSEEYKLNKSI